MTDWSTVAIAVVSAVAGFGGNIIVGLFNSHDKGVSQEREDLGFLRNKVPVQFL